jgi:hypothetical protein
MMMKRPFEGFVVAALLLALMMPGAAAQAQDGDGGLSAALRQARTVGVPQAALDRLLALGMERGVLPPKMGNLVALLAEAAAGHLPLAPFLNKIEEGLAKNVPADTITRVLSQRLDDYRFTSSQWVQTRARDSRLEGVSAEDLVRLTETLYCGLTRMDLTRVMKRHPSASPPVMSRGLETLAAFRQLRFDPEWTSRLVESGIDRGFFAERTHDFVRVVAAAEAKGVPETRIAQAAEAVVSGQLSFSRFADRLGISASDLARQGPRISSRNPDPSPAPSRDVDSRDRAGSPSSGGPDVSGSNGGGSGGSGGGDGGGDGGGGGGDGGGDGGGGGGGGSGGPG